MVRVFQDAGYQADARVRGRRRPPDVPDRADRGRARRRLRAGAAQRVPVDRAAAHAVVGRRRRGQQRRGQDRQRAAAAPARLRLRRPGLPGQPRRPARPRGARLRRHRVDPRRRRSRGPRRAGRRGGRRGRGLPPQARPRPGGRLRRLRGDRARGPRGRTAAGGRRPRLRHAGGRAQLPRDREHRPRGAAQRQPGADDPRPRPGRVLRPVRLARASRCWSGPAAATWACPPSSPRATAPTSAATTCSSTGPPTPAPRSSSCTWRASATPASSPGWPAASAGPSRWSP